MYIGYDYVDIMDYFNKCWDIVNIMGLGGEAVVA